MNKDERKTSEVERWYNIPMYVDIETGEIITKSEFERNYYLIKNEKPKFEIIGDTGYRYYAKLCRRKGEQQRLF